MKLTIVGTGYVGLVTGTCLADLGNDVICVDVDKKKIDDLNNGIIPIYEPGLEEMVKWNFEKSRLHFSTSLKDSLDDREMVFIAVGTPPDEDGSADLQYVLAVAKEIGQHMKDYTIIVDKSTVPIGTADKVRATVQAELDKRGSDLEFDVVSNPEFLREGHAIKDFLKPDRIVCGVESERPEAALKKLFLPYQKNGHSVIYMDVRSAEMTKYAANAMLATKISFMNDIANLCERVGANVNEVRRGIGSDTRIGPKFIYPGVGYGGSCFPKDVKALIKIGEENEYNMRVLQAVEDVNDSQKEVIVDKIKSHFNGDIKGKTIALWGLAFKPHTDDMREAPSIVIINNLIKAGAKVKAYDPVATEEAQRRMGDIIEYVDDRYDALEGADVLAIVTEWPEFKTADFSIVAEKLSGKTVFDGRNILDKDEITDLGMTYYPIGNKAFKK